jgi:ubiquinone/menaquinone biosynthesis C-methylase UbiE
MSSARTGKAAHSSFAHPTHNVAMLGIEHAMKVADFGAGSGAYVLAMAARLEGSGRVYAVDIQKDLLRRIHTDAAKSGYKNVEILWGDLESRQGSKIADNTLDLVLISNLLFQVEDKAAVVAEAKRVVKESGRVAIIDWSESYGGMGPRREDVVAKEAAYEIAKNAGLTFQKEFKAGAHHYGLVFRKGTGSRVKIRV